MTALRQLAWFPVVIAASPACAHSPVPGLEGFYTGMLHPFSTPSQLLVMVGLGLLVGAFAVKSARWLLCGFLVGTFAGLLMGPLIPDIDPIMFALAFAACCLVALIPGRLMLIAIALAITGGYLIGEASIPDEGPTRDRLFTMSGSIVGANVGLLYLFSIVDFVRSRCVWPWVGVAFRVIAAWLGAISLMMLALGSVEPTTL
ncbi:MAG: HupE/UreJ family protein [Dinoroseobacter sp.]|nr:HupE/UreJ family protein [Dinoroseobacter sp.]